MPSFQNSASDRGDDKAYKEMVCPAHDPSIDANNTRKPLPLTTVELQKLGSRFLGLSSKIVMEVQTRPLNTQKPHTHPQQVAEKLYTKGFISYPRTETDQFDKGMDLRALVEKQTVSADWGQFATQCALPTSTLLSRILTSQDY